MVTNNDPEVIILAAEVRNKIRNLKSRFGWKWEKWNKMVAQVIPELIITEFKYFEDHDKWGKLISAETIGSSKSFEEWSEIKQIADQIEKNQVEKEQPEKRKKSSGAINKNVIPIKVRYGVFPCQDTILPLYFEESYSSKSFQVEFKRYNNWDEGLKAFLQGEIDVALHNFPTAVAYSAKLKLKNPIFFYPYFSFNGYGIFVIIEHVKEFAKRNGLRKTQFKDLSAKEKIDFLKQSKILIERNTDFEWVLKFYCKNKLKCNENDLIIIDEQIIDCNTNTAKSKFMKDEKYSVYCTNPIHIHDLLQKKSSKLFELIAHGNNLTLHKNFNGLICSFEYYEDNREIMDEIIERWFVHTESFLRKVRKLSMHNPLNNMDTAVHFTIPALVNFLNKETKSEITVDNLPHVYDEDYNHFYENPETAFLDFYTEVLTNQQFMQNYIEITNIQLNGEPITEEKIHEAIEAIRTSMLNCKLN